MADSESGAPEEWRPVPVERYTEIYQVSSWGRLRRVVPGFRGNYQAGRFLNPSGTRYLMVALCHQGVIQRFTVHALVALAFHGPKPSPHHEVAHKNGLKHDNRASNLRWATHHENVLDMWEHGGISYGTQSHRAKITPDDVQAIRALGATRRFTQKQIAALFGISQGAVTHIMTGRTWRYLG